MAELSCFAHQWEQISPIIQQNQSNTNSSLKQKFNFIDSLLIIYLRMAVFVVGWSSHQFTSWRKTISSPHRWLENLIGIGQVLRFGILTHMPLIPTQTQILNGFIVFYIVYHSSMMLWTTYSFTKKKKKKASQTKKPSNY